MYHDNLKIWFSQVQTMTTLTCVCNLCLNCFRRSQGKMVVDWCATFMNKTETTCFMARTTLLLTIGYKQLSHVCSRDMRTRHF